MRYLFLFMFLFSVNAKDSQDRPIKNYEKTGELSAECKVLIQRNHANRTYASDCIDRIWDNKHFDEIGFRTNRIQVKRQ